MDIVEIIATVAGLIFYFWLNSRKAEQTQPAPPESTPKPKPKRKQTAVEPKRQERNYTNPKNSQEKATLQELLRQYTEPKRTTRTLEEDEGYKPKYKTYEGQFDENGMPKSFISKKDAADSRPQIKNESPETMNRLSKILSNHASLRDAFILKEVLDKKYF